MTDHIVLDITDVVARQKSSKTYNIKLATLVIGILVLCSLTVARIYDLPNELFLGGAVVVLIVAALVYNLPGSADRKFIKPYVEKLENLLAGDGYYFKDKPKNKGLKPWFSNSSSYLYGKGLTIAKDPAKGLKARILTYATHAGDTVLLSVERIAAGNKVLLRVLEVDDQGEMVESSEAENHVLPVLTSSQSISLEPVSNDVAGMVYDDEPIVPAPANAPILPPAVSVKPVETVSPPVPNIVLPPVFLPPKK